MTPFYLLAALLAALLVAVVVAGIRGGSAHRSQSVDRAGRQRDLLAQLAELEFEYQTGKIGEEEYRELRLPLAKAALAARTTAQQDVEADGTGEAGRSGSPKEVGR